MSDEWRNSFEAFLRDMGEKPQNNYTIDRIDPNGNYEKRNCRWTTMSDQAKNKRSNVRLTFNGETLILSEWAKRTGLQASTIAARLRYGWSASDALTKPVRSAK